MNTAFIDHINIELSKLAADGLIKREREILSPQSSSITVDVAGAVHTDILNLCANNYLGLANHPELIHAAQHALSEYGYGMASVRFICGTQQLHRQLEQKLAAFLGKEEAILFAACFDANGGLFEPLLDARDAIVSDALNHASIIDGIRLSKAKRFRYPNADMDALEHQLKLARASGARFIMIATDGVFSMDGHLANLPAICALAKQHDALVMVDDCHSTGFVGPDGRGTHAHYGLVDEVDILTGTLGKALGGAMGGYVAGSRTVIEWLRQRARPYLFSNALPPAIVAASLKALELVEQGAALREQLSTNTAFWREGLCSLGFDVLPGEHPIVPVMLGDAHLAQSMASALFEHNVHVAGFFYPVVPKGAARIRTQMSAALSQKELVYALEAFERSGKALGVI